jgi:hypothetical protein
VLKMVCRLDAELRQQTRKRGAMRLPLSRGGGLKNASWSKRCRLGSSDGGVRRNF